MTKKVAVLVGINYFNTRFELHGCINDVMTAKNTLVNRFGLEESNIKVMTDASDSEDELPTGKNIKGALNEMICNANPGDNLFFHFSGHGVQTVEGSKKIEAIVSSDSNLITDTDFRILVNMLPTGATFTFVSDSCHSGGLIDQEKEQVGPHTTTNARSLHPRRGIPYPVLIQHLTSISGIESNNIGVHMMHLFGSDSSVKFQLTGEDALRAMKVDNPDNAILLSGCEPDELSQDLHATPKRPACGAFSNAIQIVLNAHNGPLSNRDLVTLVRKEIKEQQLTQHPCLYCSDANADAPFIGEGSN